MASLFNSSRQGRRSGVALRAWGCFTLLEVIIAAAVLALAVVMSVGIMGGARARILRAESRWGRQHLLSQAAEIYLLGGPAAEIPRGLLPEGFSSTCTLTAVDDLSDEDLEPQQGWILGCFHVCVYDVSGDLMAECRVEKLVREEDCE
jgi:type II secretory pathway pseudopilin PulG